MTDGDRRGSGVVKIDDLKPLRARRLVEGGQLFRRVHDVYDGIRKFSRRLNQRARLGTEVVHNETKTIADL